MFAQVNADGTLSNSSGGVKSLLITTGTYEVDFSQDISSCGYAMTQGEGGVGAAGGAIVGITDRSGIQDGVFATTRDADGTLFNAAFQVIVVCPPSS